MEVYGPFALNEMSIQAIVTRTLPGVGLLCGQEGSIEQITRSDHDVAEVLLQWVRRFPSFYFCYASNGAQAQRIQEWLSVHLGFSCSEQVVGGDPRRLAKIVRLLPLESGHTMQLGEA